MGSRLNLQRELESLLGSRNVYYQPPENMKMEYPAIRYSIDSIKSSHADDIKYSKINRYKIIVIDINSDNDVIDRILEFPYSSFNTHYISNNLYHDVINLYY